MPVSRAAPLVNRDAIVTVRTHGRYDEIHTVTVQRDLIPDNIAPWLPQCLAPQESPAVLCNHG